MSLRLRSLLLPIRCMSSSTSSTGSATRDLKTDNQDCSPTPDELYRQLWIKCTGHDIGVLNSYEKFLTTTAHHLGIDHVKTETPFRKIKRRTLLASRFVRKKYRVQYEIRSYYRDLLFQNLTGSTADTFLEYVERNIPEGVLFVVEKHRLAELPFDLEK